MLYFVLFSALLIKLSLSGNNFGVNIFGADQNFDVSLIEDLIENKNVYHFRAFKFWGRPTEVINTLNYYADQGLPISLLLNIERDENLYSLKSLFNSYRFDIKVQIDSCSPSSCWNPTEGGFCQGNYNVAQYISRLNEANSLFDTDIEFVIPWQDANQASKCDYNSVLEAARSIQTSNNRKFSLAATYYNFFFGPNIGSGVFPSSNINNVASNVRNEANKYASGLDLSTRIVETGWPAKCDKRTDFGHGSANKAALCNYYYGAKSFQPNDNIIIYWWIIDERDVGDGCGYGAWGLYDSNKNFKC